jgi:hypothetical protein
VPEGGAGGQLNINITTAGLHPRVELMWPEVDMVKGALLYADSATLMSPKVTYMRLIAEGFKLDDERAAIMRASGMTGTREWETAVEIWLRIRDGYKPTTQEARLLEEYKPALLQYAKLHREQTDEVVARAQDDELDRAVALGVLRVEHIPARGSTTVNYRDAVGRHLKDTFYGALNAPEPTYPLFDAAAWAYLCGHFTKDPVVPPAVGVAAEPSLAIRLISDEAIEVFPHASIDDILDVRERLRGPLVRFRAALARASMELNDVKLTDFDLESQAFYRREVAPALAELNESLSELDAKETLRRGAEYGAAAVGVAAAGMAAFSRLIAAAAVPLGMSARAELAYRREMTVARRKNNYFFVWEVGRALRSV